MTHEVEPTEPGQPAHPAGAGADVDVLRAIAEGTARGTGQELLPSLVRHLAQAIDVPYAFVAEFAQVNTRVRTLAYWARDKIRDNVEFDLAGTPCADVVRGNLCHHPQGVSRQFPEDRSLAEMGIESYLGVALPAADGRVLGHLTVLDTRPMPPEPRRLLVFRTFAARAAAEMEQLQAEAECARLEQHNRYLQEEIKSQHNFEEIVGQSSVLRAVLDKVRLVAGTDTAVLILGETGTGKELIARAVHAQSRRKDRPLIKVNCAALPAGLLEGELFGHEEGAGTGAIARRVGRFGLAHGGTLFLDEIGAVPLGMQVKLLRVLQERKFERVGGSAPIAVNVRVLAATNRDLRRAVRAMAFRGDLYHCLSVFPIQLPPLRDRREDIPPLAHFLAAKFAARVGKRIDAVSPETMERLTAYPWPGNVRELENVIERAVILATGPTLEVGADVLAPPSPIPRSGPVSPESLDLTTLERNHIRTVLERTRWVIDGPHGAARLLGLHPNTLRSRLKKLGLHRPGHGGS